MKNIKGEVIWKRSRTKNIHVMKHELFFSSGTTNLKRKRNKGEGNVKKTII